MKRQAMVAGTTLESMQVYEILRSLELLRGQPEVDATRLAITGRYEAGINGMYAALLDGKVGSVISRLIPPLGAWTAWRDAPVVKSRSFRDLWRDRQK